MWIISLLALLLALPGAIVSIHILISLFHGTSKQIQQQEDLDGSDI